MGVVTEPCSELSCGEDVGQTSPLLDPGSAPVALPGLSNPCLIPRQFFMECSCALGSALKSQILPGNSLAEVFPVKHFLPFSSAQNFPPDFPSITEMPARMHCIHSEMFVRLSSRVLHEAALCSQYFGGIASELVVWSVPAQVLGSSSEPELGGTAL